jgi:hypothetical protein
MNHQCMIMKYLKLYFQSVARNMDLSEVILMLVLVFSFEYAGCKFRETQDPLEFSKIPILLVRVASVHRAHANIRSSTQLHDPPPPLGIRPDIPAQQVTDVRSHH